MTSILANTKITIDYYQTKNAMQQSLNIIKSYAKDSLSYGRKSGNKIAIKRGQEVGFAAANLEKHLQNLNKVVAKLKDEAIRIDSVMPDKFDTAQDWQKAVKEFTSL